MINFQGEQRDTIIITLMFCSLENCVVLSYLTQVLWDWDDVYEVNFQAYSNMEYFLGLLGLPIKINLENFNLYFDIEFVYNGTLWLLSSLILSEKNGMLLFKVRLILITLVMKL